MRWFRIFNSVQWKLVIIYISLLLIAVQLIGVYFFRSLEQYYEGNFRNQLETQADLLQGNVTELMVKRNQDSLAKREHIDDLVRQLFILNNKTDTVQIVDQDGVILSTTSDDSSLVGQKNVKVYRVLQGEVDSEEQIRPDAAGQRHMLMSYPIKEEGLVIGAIYIEAPMEEMYNTIRTINTILIKIALVALAGTGLLVIILARTITNPVKDITQQATVMAEGDFNRKVDVKSQDEIGQLATAFNHLAQHLREALSQKEEEKGKLESVLANMSDGVIATDEKGRVIVINRRAEDILGRKPKQGEDIQQVLPLSQPVSLPFTEERETYMELDREDPDHQTVVKLTFTPIRRSDQTVGLIVVLQDVTEEEKLDRQRKEFVANVSHELRTPLTTIKSYLEALDEGGAMEDKELATRFLRVTRQESERMTRLIHDLLQLSRLDSEKARPHKQPLLLFDVLQEATDRFSVQCKQKNISLHLSLAYGLLPRVYAARDQLDQVLDNLLSNAVKYTPEGGSITLSAKRRVEDGFISVSISDTGIGIPKKDLERIFERFYRVDKARSRNMGGTGLGLSIAKEIIQAHGGDIYMTSRYEKGTTVTFSLPPCEPEVVR